MRSTVFCSLLALLTLAGTLCAPAPAPAIAATRVAPADEYFGHLKMSILGIRNQLRDLETRSAWRGERKHDLLGKATFIEDAMRQWAQKYPADPWLPQFRRRLTLCYIRIEALR